MQKISCADLPWIEKRSPDGMFHSFWRDISLALGGKQNLGPRFGGYPFDVQIRRVPAGAAICPYHAHVAQSEFYLVQSGRGIARGASGDVPVKPGDFVFYPPGVAHQIIADDSAGNELVVLVVADNPDFDACLYPDAGDGASKGVANGRIFDFSAGTTTLGAIFPDAPAAPLLNFADLPWDEYASPKGKFRGASKELSVALGAKRNVPAGLGGHVFDVEYGKYEAGECGCPYHSHSAQTEFYLIVEGIAAMRTERGVTQLRTGDAALCLPHEAHQLRNDSGASMYYLCIADNPPADTWYYPDSNKHGFREPRKIFRMTEADYWDGEE